MNRPMLAFFSSRRKRTTCSLFLLLFFSPLIWSDIYKYMDANGSTVYTDRPKVRNFVKMVMTRKGWVDPTKAKNAMFLASVNKKKFHPFVQQAADDYNLPQALLHAVITTESAYNPWAVSSAGAMGLMQLMPDTAKRYGVHQPFNPQQNIRGGSRYLRDLVQRFHGDWALVLAAYNAGEGAVEKYGNTIPPYEETQNYVRKVRDVLAETGFDLSLMSI